jgi:chromosome segregation ATPase
LKESEKISENSADRPKPSPGNKPIGGVRSSWAFLFLATVTVVALAIASFSVWNGLQHQHRLKADIKKLEVRKKTLDVSIDEIERGYKGRSKKQAELERLNRALKTVERAVGSASRKLQEIQKNNATGEAKLAGQLKSIEDNKSRNSNLNSENENLRQKRDELTRENSGLNNELSGLRNDVKIARAKAAKELDLVRNLKKKSTGLETGIQGLERKGKELQVQINDRERDLTKINREIGTLKGEIKAHQDNKVRREAEISSLNKRHEQAQKKLIDVQSSLHTNDDKTTALEKTKALLIQKKALLIQKEERVNELTRKISQLEPQVSGLEQTLKSKQSELGTVESKITNKKNDSKRLTSQLGALKSDVQEANSKSRALNRLDAEIKTKTETVQKVRKSLAVVRVELGSQQNSARRRLAEVARATEDLRKTQELQAEYGVTRKQLADAKQELANLRAEIAALKKQAVESKNSTSTIKNR